VELSLCIFALLVVVFCLDFNPFFFLLLFPLPSVFPSFIYLFIYLFYPTLRDAKEILFCRSRSQLIFRIQGACSPSLPPAIPTISNWKELPYPPHLTPLKPHQENTTLLLVISQIWLNYFLDDYHFGYTTKSLKETLPWDVEEARRKTAWCIVLPDTKKNPSWRSIPRCVCN